MFDVSQLSNVFKVSVEVVKYLKHSGIQFEKHAILDHNEKVLRFRYYLSLGSKSSHTESIVRTVKSKLAKKLEIRSPLPPRILLVPGHEEASGYVTTTGNLNIIDIAAMYERISADFVIIEFEESLDDQLRDALFPIPYTSRNPIYCPDKIVEIPIEMLTDFGRFWYEEFDSFRIINVKRTGGLDYIDSDLLNLLPQGVKRVIETCRNSKSLTPEMMRELQHISDELATFATDPEVKSKLKRAICTDKPSNVIVEDVRATTVEEEIHGRRWHKPNGFQYDVLLELDGKDLALSAKLFIDIKVVDEAIIKYAEKVSLNS